MSSTLEPGDIDQNGQHYVAETVILELDVDDLQAIHDYIDTKGDAASSHQLAEVFMQRYIEAISK